MSTFKAHIKLAPSAARTATETFNIDDNNLSNGAFVVDITAAGTPVTDTLTVTIDGYDPTSGKWYNLLTSTALDAVGTTVLRVGDYTPAAANLSAQDFLPKKLRVVATKNTATSMTYSIGVNLSD